MRPLPSSPAHPLDPASLGISERDKGKGLKWMCWQHRTGTAENSQLQRPAVAPRQGKLSAATAHLPAGPVHGHGPQRASHCPESEMVRDFLHPKLRFGTESSFELLDSQGTNQKAQAETGRALGKKQGALTCLRPCLWQGRPWTEPQETCMVLFPMPTSAHTLPLTTSSGWAQVPLPI